MNLVPFLVIWGVVFLVGVALLAYRRTLTLHEDDTIHVLAGEEKYIAEQAVRAKKLQRVDLWGKIIIIVLVVGGLAILVAYGYFQFLASGRARVG